MNAPPAQADREDEIVLLQYYLLLWYCLRRLHGGTGLSQAVGADDARLQGGPRGGRSRNPSDKIPRGKWWEIFGDPQLNALEEQVSQANQNVKVAEARFRQARALIGFFRAGIVSHSHGRSERKLCARFDEKDPLHRRRRAGHLPATFF